jgi:DNA-binding NarL/FixJ family response regulator
MPEQSTENRRMAGNKELDFLLTAEEKLVLDLIAEGLTNREIATDLHMNPATVKRHTRKILDRLHLQNRVQAAVYHVRCMHRLPVGRFEK